MHGDALNGSGQQPVSHGYPGVVQESERYGAASDMETDNAEEHGLRRSQERIEEDRRRGDDDPASGGDTGDDAGRWERDQGSLCGPTVEHRGNGQDERGRDTEPAATEPEKRKDVSQTVTRVPAPLIDKAVGLGADVGLVPVIEATADQTPEEVYQSVINGNQQLWVVAQSGTFIGTVVTQIELRSTDKVLVVKYMAGKTFKSWLDVLHDTLSEFGREQGCTAMETHSREALRKPLIQLGWAKVAVLYRVPLDG